METVPFTKEGFDKLTEELERLTKVDRHEVIAAIADARAHGDLKENAEYHAAREKQGFIEARISDLEDKLSRGQVIDYDGASFDVIKFGASVKLSDEETGVEKSYKIVGHLEANLEENKISLHSPVAKALMGKKIDDLVEIRVPKGVQEYIVVEISY